MGNIQANENHNERKVHLQKELELRLEFCHTAIHYNKNIFNGTSINFDDECAFYKSINLL